jgi:hypothetical protein
MQHPATQILVPLPQMVQKVFFFRLLSSWSVNSAGIAASIFNDLFHSLKKEEVHQFIAYKASENET